MQEAENILRCISPSQWTEVRYEDYCKDPEVTLSRLHQFLGVEPDRRSRAFRSVEQHVVGNGMRLDPTSDVRVDERWRDVLTEQDRRTFDEIAGVINRRYGYQ